MTTFSLGNDSEFVLDDDDVERQHENHSETLTSECEHGITGLAEDNVNVSCPKCLFENPVVVAGCLVLGEGGTSMVEWIRLDRIVTWTVRTPPDARSTLEIIVNGSARRVYTPNPHGLARAIAEACLGLDD